MFVEVTYGIEKVTVKRHYGRLCDFGRREQPNRSSPVRERPSQRRGESVGVMTAQRITCSRRNDLREVVQPDGTVTVIEGHHSGGWGSATRTTFDHGDNLGARRRATKDFRQARRLTYTSEWRVSRFCHFLELCNLARSSWRAVGTPAISVRILPRASTTQRSGTSSICHSAKSSPSRSQVSWRISSSDRSIAARAGIHA